MFKMKKAIIADNREKISKAMGWWSPSGFDAYEDKTTRVIELIRSELEDLLANQTSVIYHGANFSDVQQSYGVPVDAIHQKLVNLK